MNRSISIFDGIPLAEFDRDRSAVLEPTFNKSPGLAEPCVIAFYGSVISFHYLPPSRKVTAEPAVISKLEEVLQKHGINYKVGLSWTTDAPYRETRQKIARRKAEGCLTVEMEFAALLAVARFRKVPFGQYLLAGDDVSGEEWDRRDWSDKPSDHKRIFWLAVEAVLSLSEIK